MAEGSIMELMVEIKALDYFTGPLRKMVSSITEAESKMASINNTMKLMGSSAAEIDAVNASLQKMADQQAFANVATDLEKIGMAKEDIAAMESSYMRMAQYQRDMAEAQEKYAAGQELVQSGVGALTTGAIGAAGIVELVKSAGEFQSTMTVIQGITGATASQMKGLSQAVQDASTKVSKYTDYQTGAFAQQLASSGFNANQIQSLLLPVAKFAEVQSYEGKQSDPTEAVNQAIQMAHAFGLYNPNQLTGFLNTFNKYSVMQPDSSTSLYQTLQYLNPVGKMLGMSQSDELAMAAIDNRIGLTGSHGGTNSADFIMRLIPGLINTPAAVASMRKLGFEDKNGNSPFFTKNGTLTNLNGLLNTMVSDSKKYNPEQLTALYKNIFGIQGGRAASLLANPKSIEQLQKMQAQLGHVDSIDQMNAKLQATPEGQLNLLKSNSIIMMQRVGQQLAMSLNPAIQQINILLNDMLKFSQVHPQIAKLIGDFALLMVGGKMTEGVVKIIAGNFKMLGGALDMLKLTTKAGELTKLGSVVENIKNVFGDFKISSLLRFSSMVEKLKGVFSDVSIGVRLFASSIGARLGSAIMTGLEWFGKLQFMIVETGIKIATWAYEVAADWLVAMGPVGWIILGVTAVIAAGVLAWKTNFFGFRTTMIGVWNDVKNDASAAWNWIKSTVLGVMNWFNNLPSQMMQIGKNMMQGLQNGISSMIGAVGNTIKNIGTGVVNTFKNLLGIHSPSTVFMEHGKNIVQGLVLGMDQNAYTANNSTQRLANGVTNSFRPNIGSSSNMAMNSAGGGLFIQQGAIVINAGTQSPQEIADMVLQKIGTSARSSMMSMGSNMNIAAMVG